MIVSSSIHFPAIDIILSFFIKLPCGYILHFLNYRICKQKDGTEIIMLSERSQTQKVKYAMLSHSFVDPRSKVMMIMMMVLTMGCECKWWTV
jgi:hypothetical protein